MEQLKMQHAEIIKLGMASLLSDTDLADVNLTVNGRVFSRHRAVLVAVSPYFRTMFTGSLLEATTHQTDITLQDLDDSTFSQFRQFAYTGHLEMEKVEQVDMLEMAAIFQVDCLQATCEGLLLKQLKAPNCIQMFRLACMYNCQDLKSKSWQVVLDHFCNIWQSEDFVKLSLEEIIEIVKEDRLFTLDEEHVCEAVLRWIDHDSDSRQKYALKLFSHVRLPHVRSKFIVHKLCQVSYLVENVHCRRLLDEAQHFHMMSARQMDYSGPRMKYRVDDDYDEVLLVLKENKKDKGSFYEGGYCLWALNYQQCRWFTLAPIPINDSPGTHFAICSYGYDLFLSAGTNNPKSLLRYESERNEWTTSTGQLRKMRTHHTMVSLGNALYCIGSLRQYRPIDSIEEYSILGHRWLPVGELVYSATSAVSGEQVLVFGGIGKHGHKISNVQDYHVRHKEPTVISQLPFISKQFHALTIGKDICLLSLEREKEHVLKLTSDFGFVDAGFYFSLDKKVLGVAHHENNSMILTEDESTKGYLGDVIKVNTKASQVESLAMGGKPTPKPFHACHRLYVDKKFLYHTYFQ
ncbi:kelch-like protein 29 isoform X2 [Dreissena polymorpha]|uniref:kelch-like protein 29 isoform X2 n=1 Tax=Dreissena polymorpha TaxID=45954 RepID=UPI0022653D66|nr:kelch-like protein 29 isoform X2 [Dreissena polymorpha]